MIELGLAKLVGISTETIVQEAQHLLNNSKNYEAICLGVNPYGDGQATWHIVQALRDLSCMTR